MTNSTSTRLKAFFLLAVFAINTLVGFACSIGLNINLNSRHQDHESHEASAVSIHVHADGKKHEHHNKSKKNHHAPKKEDSQAGSCCSDKVVKFHSLDKCVVQSATATKYSPIFESITTFLSRINILKSTLCERQKYIARFSLPPPPDIRILIQSFQI